MRKKNKKMLVAYTLIVIYVILKIIVIYTPSLKDDAVPDAIIQILLKQG